jgi:carbon-monoxide dehydrogenase small subunit
VERIVIPGVPDGAALERASLLPSAPPLVAVAVTVAFSGEKCSRARIALCGLDSRPLRVLEAEAQVERTGADEAAQRKAAAEAARHAGLRSERSASTGYKRRLIELLTRRALRRALLQAREGQRPVRRQPRSRSTSRGLSSLSYFTSGRVELTVNGKPMRAEAEARTTLAGLLRREGLRGTKDVCGTGRCGACTVLLDGRPVLSCLTLAVRAQGRTVHTVEGLTTGKAGLLPAAFASKGAVHCGFCTPGMEMAARALFDSGPNPSEDDAKDALSGCLCPCQGAQLPLQAVLAADPRSAS